jgi:chaperonin GroEL
MKNVATISANSDKTIGHMVAETVHKVGEEGVVTVEYGSGLSDEVKIVEGYQFESGYISSHFATDRSKMITEFEDPLIIFVDQKVSHIRDLVPILEKIINEGAPVVIIAEDVDGDALTTLAVNHIKGKMGAVAIKAPGMGEIRSELLQDMAVTTGGTVISKELELTLQSAELHHLGSAKKVIVSSDETTIVAGEGEPIKIQHRIDALRGTPVQDTQQKQVLDARISKLIGKVGVIEVGGMSELEMKERKDRVDDALFATQAAVKEGVLPGGGTALFKLMASLSTLEGENPHQNAGIRAVQKALLSPLKQIVENAGCCSEKVEKALSVSDFEVGYNCTTQEFENMFKSGVIDPTKVTRSALQNAVSVAGMLLTTQCVITEGQEDKDKRLKRIQAMQEMVSDLNKEEDE